MNSEFVKKNVVVGSLWVYVSDKPCFWRCGDSAEYQKIRLGDTVIVLSACDSLYSKSMQERRRHYTRVLGLGCKVGYILTVTFDPTAAEGWGKIFERVDRCER